MHRSGSFPRRCNVGYVACRDKGDLMCSASTDPAQRTHGTNGICLTQLLI